MLQPWLMAAHMRHPRACRCLLPEVLPSQLAPCHSRCTVLVCTCQRPRRLLATLLQLWGSRTMGALVLPLQHVRGLQGAVHLRMCVGGAGRHRALRQAARALAAREPGQAAQHLPRANAQACQRCSGMQHVARGGTECVCYAAGQHDSVRTRPVRAGGHIKCTRALRQT